MMQQKSENPVAASWQVLGNDGKLVIQLPLKFCNNMIEYS